MVWWGLGARARTGTRLLWQVLPEYAERSWTTQLRVTDNAQPDVQFVQLQIRVVAQLTLSLDRTGISSNVPPGFLILDWRNLCCFGGVFTRYEISNRDLHSRPVAPSRHRPSRRPIHRLELHQQSPRRPPLPHQSLLLITGRLPSWHGRALSAGIASCTSIPACSRIGAIVLGLGCLSCGLFCLGLRWLF